MKKANQMKKNRNKSRRNRRREKRRKITTRGKRGRMEVEILTTTVLSIPIILSVVLFRDFHDYYIKGNLLLTNKDKNIKY